MLRSLFHLAKTSSSSGSAVTALLPFLLLIVVFYFLLIRPQQRRARAQRELMGNLSVGDEVVTVGGMFGTVHAMDDDEVTLEIAQDVFVRFRRSSIGARLTYDEPAEEIHQEKEEEADDQP